MRPRGMGDRGVTTIKLPPEEHPFRNWLREIYVHVTRKLEPEREAESE
jgi:hypothetical protein